MPISISVPPSVTQPMRHPIHKGLSWSMMASPVIITMYIFQPAKEKRVGDKKNTNKQTNKQKNQEMGLTHSLPISIVAKVTDAYFPVS